MLTNSDRLSEVDKKNYPGSQSFSKTLNSSNDFIY